MTQTPALQHALYFKEGTFLMMANDGVYFLPHGHAKAYLCYGEKKELFGKVSRTMKSTNPDVKSYSLTYEFEGTELLAARLLTPAGRSKGTLLPRAFCATLERQLNDGSLTLQRPQNPPHMCTVSRLPDGQILLHVRELPGHDYETLWLGKPGDYRKLEIAQAVQGGSSFYFTLKDGTRVELPRGLMGGTRPGEYPKFSDDIITYLPQDNSGKDFETYGLAVAKPAPHLDPYSPELRPATRAPAPKGP